MEPQAKRSRRYQQQSSQQPFPVTSIKTSSEDFFEFTGYYTGIGVEIFDPTAISNIHKHGCFGSQTSDTVTNKTESIVLFPEETFFLHHSLHCLRVVDLNEKTLDTSELYELFARLKPRFIELYVAFVYLRSKNWVIKCGLKFGGDFCKLNIFLFLL